MSWSARFEDPIPLPNGRKLVTLKDAGAYITSGDRQKHWIKVKNRKHMAMSRVALSFV
jgi:hypothetical protein